MKSRLVIGLTGGIGSGKTEVLKRFAKLGIPTTSSDELAHEALQPGGRAYRAAVRGFGPGILTSKRTIDRRRLGRIVFADEAKRRRLEQIVHPHVIQALKRFALRNNRLVVLDIPLLFEANLEKLVDVIVCVWCRPAQQIERVARRSGLSPSEVRARMRAQWSLDLKAEKSDFVIDNSGLRSSLMPQIRGLLASLSQRARTRGKRKGSRKKP